MTPEQFVYWLQGYFEIGKADGGPSETGITSEQCEVIEDHLGKVFNNPPKPRPSPPKNDESNKSLSEMFKDIIKEDKEPEYWSWYSNFHISDRVNVDGVDWDFGYMKHNASC